MSVYMFLEVFAKLEKRLNEGQAGSAASKGQPAVYELRNKLDKFIKALVPSDIQVCVCVCVRSVHKYSKIFAKYYNND